MRERLDESTIRDKLAESISIISPDLILIEKEYYLPNISGTRGFVDLLAKDSENRFVVVEIKRSNAASREALHEILKYVEALKQNKLVNDSEISVVIVSTEWKELLVPFSSFVKRVKFDVRGYMLTVAEDFSPLHCERISPLNLIGERLFSPIHGLSLYSDEENLKKGIQSHHAVFRHKGINDYVLVIMVAPKDLRERGCEQIDKLTAALGISVNLQEIPYYPYIIYSVFTRLPKSHYINKLRKNREVYDEIMSAVNSLEDKSKEIELYEDNLINNLSPYPFSQEVEISYPAKFSTKLLEEEKWTIDKILKFGALGQNDLLEDSVIVSEMSGGQGSDGVMFRSKSNSDNISKIEEIRLGVKRVLYDNKTWLNHVNIILQHNIERNDYFNLNIECFSPRNILLSLYRQVHEVNGDGWLPTYRMHFKFSNTLADKLYVGVLAWDGTKPNLNDVIDKYYMGKPFGVVVPMIWGGFEENDFSIMKDLGFYFDSVLYEANSDRKVSRYKYDDFGFMPTEFFDTAYSDFLRFLKENKDFMDALIILINNHFDYSTGLIMNLPQ